MAYEKEPLRDKREQTLWYMGSQQAMHLHNLITKATRHYLSGDIGNWYWTLSALRENVNYDLKDTERKELDEIEKVANIHYSKWLAYKNRKEEGHPVPLDLKKSRGEFSTVVREYQRKIFDLLRDIGHFPKKEDTTKLGF